MAQRYGVIRPRSLAAACAVGRTEGLVFAALCTYADPDGANVFPSQEAIAQMLSLKRRAVTYAIANLASAGIIVKDGHGPRGVVKWRIASRSDAHHGANLESAEDAAGTHPGANLEAGQVSTPVRTYAPNEGPGTHPGARGGTHPGANDQNILPEHKRPHSDPTRARGPVGVPNVDSPQAALDPEPDPPRGAGKQPKSSDPTVPTNGHPAPPSRWGNRMPPGRPETEAERQAGVARRLVDEGLLDHVARAGRHAACLALVIDYERAQPKSSALDWILAADWPQLDGRVRARAAWIYEHLDGYGRRRWNPENQDGSVRQWHAALLAGDMEAAAKLAGVEVGYAPERMAKALKAAEEPKRRRRNAEPAPGPAAPKPRETLEASGGVMRELAFDGPPFRAREAAAALEGLAQDQARRAAQA